MSEIQQRSADERLLEVLLTEEFEVQHAIAARTTERGRLLTLPMTRRQRPTWRITAAVLLGVAVVTLSMLGKAGAEPNQPAQDAQDLKVLVPKTVDEYLKLLAEAERIQFVPKETVGAGRVEEDNRSVDRLDTVRWPEVVRIEGEQLAEWREALVRCVQRTKKTNTSGFVYDFELVLPKNRVVRSFLSVLDEDTRIWIVDGHPLHPDEKLDTLIQAAHGSATELRRRALGQANNREQLLAIPRDARRLEVSAGLLAAMDVPARLPEIARLKVSDKPDAATWGVLAKFAKLQQLELVGASLDEAGMRSLCKLSGLQALTLRGCTGFEGENLRALGALRKLHTLHLIDTAPGGATLDLQGLASLPRLREFGLRGPGRIEQRQLETISRTKIERLLLVDLDMQGDLGLLANLPSLQDVVLVGSFSDGYLQPLSRIRSLRLLTIRNAKVNGSFCEAIMSDVPQCEIDWTLDSRWWQTDYAFRYIERAWPVR